jgi:Bacterial extracellular solute-binding protein
MPRTSRLPLSRRLALTVLLLLGLFGVRYHREIGGLSWPDDLPVDFSNLLVRLGLRHDLPAQPTIGIACDAENDRLLRWARDELAKSPEGAKQRIDLLPLGSIEGAAALVAGDARIHVWCPVSTLYKDAFLDAWQMRHGANPIVHAVDLALSPMVLVMWKERYQAFVGRYREVSFRTLSQAAFEPTGWLAIAGRGDWGAFKLGHPRPDRFNSGLGAVVLMAYDYHDKTKSLRAQDVLDPDFDLWFQAVEKRVVPFEGGSSALLREMERRGPAAFDAVLVEESVAIQALRSDPVRFKGLRLVYPQRNLWNRNPYCILEAPQTDAFERQAALRFAEFLRRVEVQRRLPELGLRPVDPTIPLRYPGSPFVDAEAFGLQIDLGSVCDPPRAEVVNALLAGWQRTR